MTSRLLVDKIEGKSTTTSLDLSAVTNLQMPAGMIIQVVSAESSGADGNDTFTSSTSFGDASHSVTITPKTKSPFI